MPSILSGEYLTDIVELREGLHRREIVDVDAYDFVSYLREHGVVKLEETQLHAALDTRFRPGRLDTCLAPFVGGLFELREHVVGPTDYARRHTRELGHVDRSCAPILRARACAETPPFRRFPLRTHCSWQFADKRLPCR